MADLGILALGTFTNVADTAIQGSDPVLEVIGSADDADYVYTVLNATGGATAVFALGDTPADFGNMDSLSVQLRYAWAAGSQVNTWAQLNAYVVSAADALYTNVVTVASGITTTTPTNSAATAFTLNAAGLAASKADWDGAKVRVEFAITRVKGGDTLQKRVHAAQITGTYTAAAAVPKPRLFMHHYKTMSAA